MPEGPVQPKRRRARRWLLAVAACAAALVAVAVLAVVVVIDRAQPSEPGAFYALPSPLPAGEAGTIIRSEPVDDPPEGANGWKILYLSTGYDGAPTAMSGLLFVPTAPAPASGRDIVAVTHGTTGVAPGCAVSLIGPDYWPGIDGLPQFIRAGFAVVVPDYQGLGTPGPHPYLVGDAEATATLDAVRAAHLFEPAGAGTRFVVWGASQGAHAALFTGQEASVAAPELTLVGVATAAPAADLKTLFEVNKDGLFGKVLSAYTLATWTKVYPDLRLDQLVTTAARPIVRKLSTVCVFGDTKVLVAQGVLTSVLELTYLSKLPWETEPWKGLTENTPGGAAIGAPLIVTQGEADRLVRPSLTATFVEKLCNQGETVAYRTYPGVGHVDGGPEAAADVAAWIADRFAGKTAPSSCSG